MSDYIKSRIYTETHCKVSKVIFIMECYFFVISFTFFSVSVEVVRFNLAGLPPDTLAEDVALRFTRPDSYVGVR